MASRAKSLSPPAQAVQPHGVMEEMSAVAKQAAEAMQGAAQAERAAAQAVQAEQTITLERMTRWRRQWRDVVHVESFPVKDWVQCGTILAFIAFMEITVVGPKRREQEIKNMVPLSHKMVSAALVRPEQYH